MKKLLISMAILALLTQCSAWANCYACPTCSNGSNPNHPYETNCRNNCSTCSPAGRGGYENNGTSHKQVGAPVNGTNHRTHIQQGLELPKGASSEGYYPDGTLQNTCQDYFDECRFDDAYAELKCDLCVCPEVACRLDAHYRSLKACFRPLLRKFGCQNAELCKLISNDCCCSAIRTQEKCIKETRGELKECLKIFEENVRYELDWKTRRCFNKLIKCEKKNFKYLFKSCGYCENSKSPNCEVTSPTRPVQPLQP